MAEVRTLTTLFDFRTDLSGLKVYEESITRIKGLAMEVGKMFGLYFAVDKIMEYTGEIVKAGKEMNRINTQISQLIRGHDDLNTITNSLYETAQKLGVEYNEVADTFRDFLNDSQDSKISQEQLLAATENVHKSLLVGKTNAAQAAEAMSAINRALRMGKVGPRQIGVLLDTPGLRQFLSEVAGGDEALRKLVKTGKFTGEQLIEFLSKPSRRLEDDFNRMPMTLGRTFTRIRNELGAAAAQIWKLTGGFSRLGNIIWWTFQTASNAVKYFVNALGGLEAALQAVGIALALVIGPWAIRQLYMMAARFTALAIASWTIWLPWLAIGAAIVVAALAIQDFMIWMSGDKRYKTRFGEWLGPFEDFKKKMEGMFTDSPFFAIVRAFQDFGKGDWSKGFTELKTALTDVNGILGLIITAVTITIPLGFTAWAGIKFVELVKSLLGVKKVAEEVGASVAAVGEGGTTAGGKGKSGTTTPAAKPKGTGRISKGVGAIGIAAGVASAFGLLGEGRWADAASGAGYGAMIGSVIPGLGSGIGAAIGGVLGFASKDIMHPEALKPGDAPWGTFAWMKKQGWFDNITKTWDTITKPVGKDETPVGTFGWFKKKLGWGSETGDAAPGAQSSTLPGSGRGPPAAPISMGLTDMAQLMAALTYGSMPWDVGATARTAAPTNNVTTTVSPTYNITATMQPDEQFMADMIQQKVQATAPDLAGQVARQIQDAMPRTERATQ